MLLVAVAVAVALVAGRGRRRSPTLAVTLEVRTAAPGGAHRVAAAGVGDEVAITAVNADAVWVYRSDGPLIARCPGGPRCRITGRTIGLELTATVAGRYRIVAVAGDAGMSPSGTFDADVLAARGRGMAVELRVLQVTVD